MRELLQYRPLNVYRKGLTRQLADDKAELKHAEQAAQPAAGIAEPCFGHATKAKSPTCVALFQAPLRGRGWGEGEQAASRMRPKTTYNYDPNGNLLALNRNGDAANLNMDDFTYNYEAGRNRLTHVEDVYGNVTGNDLPNQPAGNYRYDAMGNLVRDQSEEIASIEWDVRGKVRKVTRTANSQKSDLEFFYDALGQRVMKVERKKNVAVGGVLDVTTIYTRDATGNVMAVYSNERVRVAGNPNGPVNTIRNTLTLDEHHIYGASRLGMETYENVVLADFTTINHPVFSTIIAWPVTPNNELAEQRNLKRKRYELNSHQSSVQITVSDRKLSVQQGTTTQTAFYTADVISYGDYYSFGMQKPGRVGAEPDAKYRYKHQGQESDSEILGEGNSYAYEYRMSDARLGRFWRVDPLASKYPYNSPYAFSENRVIDRVELEGLEAARPEEKQWAYRNLYDAWIIAGRTGEGGNRGEAQSWANFYATTTSKFRKWNTYELADGRADAFRHGFWNAMNARDIGSEEASDFATLHELGETSPAIDPSNPDYDPVAVQMDLHNNYVGRRIGDDVSYWDSDDYVRKKVLDGIERGDYLIIKTNSQGQWLDKDGNVTTDVTKKVLIRSNGEPFTGELLGQKGYQPNLNQSGTENPNNVDKYGEEKNSEDGDY